MEGRDLMDFVVIWTVLAMAPAFIAGRWFQGLKNRANSLTNTDGRSRARNARATDGGVPVAFEDAPVSLSDSSHIGAK